MRARRVLACVACGAFLGFLSGGAGSVPPESGPAAGLSGSPEGVGGGLEEETCGYWRFDEGAGDIAQDSSSHGHHGIVSGASWVRTPFGNGLSFDSWSDHVDISSVEPISTGTIEAWVFPEGFCGEQEIVSGVLLCDFETLYDQFRAVTLTSDGIVGEFVCDSTLKVGEWRHVAVVKSRPTVTIYVDGERVGSGDLPDDTFDPGRKYIGMYSEGGCSWYGILDEVRIYPRALSASEILSRYEEDIERAVFDRFIRGDANQDGTVNISDALAGLGALFLGWPSSPCEDAADADDNGKISVADPVFTLLALFLMPDPIPEPWPGCGLDPTIDDPLGCPGYPACP